MEEYIPTLSDDEKPRRITIYCFESEKGDVKDKRNPVFLSTELLLNEEEKMEIIPTQELLYAQATEYFCRIMAATVGIPK